MDMHVCACTTACTHKCAHKYTHTTQILEEHTGESSFLTLVQISNSDLRDQGLIKDILDIENWQVVSEKN